MVGLGCSAKKTQRQGTAVTKKYQTTEFDTSTLTVPEQVSVAMEEIAAPSGVQTRAQLRRVAESHVTPGASATPSDTVAPASMSAPAIGR